MSSNTSDQLRPAPDRKEWLKQYVQNNIHDFDFISLTPRDKTIFVDEWSTLPKLGLDTLLKDIDNDRNIGIRTGHHGLYDVDIDCEDGALIADLFFPASGCTFGRDNSSRRHYVYRQPGAELLDRNKWEVKGVMELRSYGLQTMFAGSIHPSGATVVLRGDGKPAEALYDYVLLRSKLFALATLIGRNAPDDNRQVYYLHLAGWLAEKFENGYLDDCVEVDDLELVIRTAARLAGDEEWDKREGTIASSLKTSHHRTGLTTLQREYGLSDAFIAQLKRLGDDLRPPQDDEEDKSAAMPTASTMEVKASCTDVGNAERFVNQHSDRLRYVHGLGWHKWSRNRWEIDKSDRQSSTLEFAKKTANGILMEAGERGAINAEHGKALFSWALKSKSEQGLRAMVSVAKSDPSISAFVDDMDIDLNVLNCPNGTVDLRTGEIRRAEQSDNITKVTRARYNPDAACPTWLEHLRAVFCGDHELIDYFQRCVGYSLTGLTVEQVGFFPTGDGANGKSTTLEALMYAIGDYGVPSDPVILLSGRASGGSKVDSLKADLVGARFVTMSENDAGTKLNQADFKKMMSGNPISAKKLYEAAFVFKPIAKMWFDVNHLPNFDGTDDAMNRRIKNIPFNAKFKRGDKGTDGLRSKKLEAEAEGILAWAIAGAVEWHRRGGTQGSIGTCEAVEKATDAYIADNDPIREFLTENYSNDDPNAYVPVAHLQGALQERLEERRKPRLGRKDFGKHLARVFGDSVRSGLKKSGGMTQQVYFGLRKREPDELSGAVEVITEPTVF